MGMEASPTPLSDNDAVDKVSVLVLNNVKQTVHCLHHPLPHCELTLIARLWDKHKYQTSPESGCVVSIWT